MTATSMSVTADRLRASLVRVRIPISFPVATRPLFASFPEDLRHPTSDDVLFTRIEHLGIDH
jgi:hypothetical protein